MKENKKERNENKKEIRNESIAKKVIVKIEKKEKRDAPEKN